MKLQKLEIKNLYGFMNKTIDFNKQLNLLVGINGSGKTSVLNVISWIMQPSWVDLCTIEFKKLQIEFYYESKKHVITCTQTESNLTISIKEGTKQHKPLIAALTIPPSNLISNPNLKEFARGQYEKLQPTPDEIEAWTYFLNLPNPIVISIDRKFDEKSERKNDSKLRVKNISNQTNSIESVKFYSNEAFSIYNKRIIDLNKILRDEILLSSFESTIIDLNNVRKSSKGLSVNDVNKLEINIIKFLEEDNSDQTTTDTLKNAVKNYAAEMRTIVDNYFKLRKEKGLNTNKDKKQDSKNNLFIDTNYIINSNQFTRIEKILKAFSKYEEDSSTAYRAIDIYLKSINHFLQDSSKDLFFKKENGQLYFNIKDKNNKPFIFEQTIDGLSSGEKQILILFTYLAFGNTTGKIFIIDEPEISLHPKWQDDFLQQLRNVTPTDTQLIIATHSPSIVGELEEDCKILLPYNE
ncbi:hypothetical protein E5K00_10830 [Hymenobacter aquaticus]|uniref:Endonuclease GajA/Old nuclease/RecF-like AAA domain-containing protein n=1 Tax=Hymenobacter aquaticus TaxID=1867101 RepID=A0A4Z0Q7H9_9BACT|nr:ATP-binding protein [Hymenobacter aquaticus]TGE25655.1 hypothetical protein E5K00_10830 [Hymenobacter aquaticus]